MLLLTGLSVCLALYPTDRTALKVGTPLNTQDNKQQCVFDTCTSLVVCHIDVTFGFPASIRVHTAQSVFV